MGRAMTETTAIRPLPQCAAKNCTRLPTSRVGMCVGHVRALQMTAAITDGLREFLRSAAIPVDCETDRDAQRAQHAIEAGEYFAIGLSLLVSTQFDEPLSWNGLPIQKRNHRWRVEFGWQIGDSVEFDGDDETTYGLEDEPDETKDLDDEPIGAMVR